VTPEDSKKAKGIIHWVSISHAIKSEVVLYDRLFTTPSPGKDQVEENFLLDLNQNSFQICQNAVVEESLAFLNTNNENNKNEKKDTNKKTFQFERLGYFSLDVDTISNKVNQLSPIKNDVLRFNRVVTLKDTWNNNANNSNINNNNNQTISNNKKTPLLDNNNSNNNSNNIEDIRRVELRVGLILSVEKHPDADTLYIEKIDCGDATGPRTIISGLVKYFTVDQLIGQKVVVLCNLKPTKMRGVLSEGMLLAASKSSLKSDNSNELEKETVEILKPPVDAKVGELIKIDGYEDPCPDEQLKSKSAAEVWKRVSSKLLTNDNREAVFDTKKLLTSCGPCTVQSLVNAFIK
jgi:methionine--tRNA ligase beta chain